MKLLSCGALVLFAAVALGQQQAPPPHNSPPYATPPTFPQEQKPTEPMPPDTKAPPPTSIPAADVQNQIEKKLATEPLLANADVHATVDDNSVVLTGTVENEQQHDLALRIAESYAGDRKIIDKVQLQQKS
jgi:hypothetical protein